MFDQKKRPSFPIPEISSYPSYPYNHKFNHRSNSFASVISNPKNSSSSLQLFVETPREENAIEKLGQWLTSRGIDVNSFIKNQQKHHSRISEDEDEDLCKDNIIFSMRNILPILLKSKDNLNYTNENDENILHIYLANIESDYRYSNGKSKVFEIIKTLIDKGVSVNAVDKWGRTPLHIAAKTEKMEIVRLMLDYFSNIDICDENGNTVLHNVMQGYCNKDLCLDIVKILLKKYANPNIKNFEGKTPVHIAAETNKLEVVKLMLDFFNDVDVCDNHGNTVLHTVIRKNVSRSEVCFDVLKDHICLNVVKILLSRGADPNRKTKKGYTPVQLAAGSCNVRLLQILQEYGADFNVITDKNENLLLLVCKYSDGWNDSVINFLVKQGSEINILDKDGYSPLYYAVMKNKSIDILIKLGANVNWQSKLEGKTILHYAVENLCNKTYLSSREQMTVMALLRAGSYCDIVDSKGRTPLDIVLEDDDYRLLERILEFGGNINNPNTIKLSDKCRQTTRHIVLLHAAKLLAIGLPVAEIYENRVYLEVNGCHKCYMKEVEKLKSFKIRDGVSLYQYIHMHHRKQLAYVDCLPKDLERRFPIYCNFILKIRAAVVKRSPLLQPAMMAWYKVTNIYLPELCVERILDFLDNGQLQVLINGAEETFDSKNGVIRNFVSNSFNYTYKCIKDINFSKISSLFKKRD